MENGKLMKTVYFGGNCYTITAYKKRNGVNTCKVEYEWISDIYKIVFIGSYDECENYIRSLAVEYYAI